MVAGISVVYWKAKEHNAEKCPTDMSTVWSNQLAAIDYDMLYEYFNGHNGTYRNITLLTMSLPQYCQVAQCIPMDIIDPSSDHPHDQGNAIFADLLIWQLLRLFENIYGAQCTLPPSSLPYESMSGMEGGGNHISSSSSSSLSLSSSDTFHPWMIENRPMEPITHPNILNYIKKIPRIRHDSRFKWKVTKVFTFHTPVIREPLPVDQLAVACLPTPFEWKQKTNRNVFDLSSNLPLGDPLWVPLDVLMAINHNCSGWIHRGLHSEFRTDDTHGYSAEMTTDCYDDEMCSKPQWNSTQYPHRYWGNLPQIKSSDFMLRVSTKLVWHQVCFIKCNPVLVWRNRTTTTAMSSSTLSSSSSSVVASDEWNKIDLKNSNHFPLGNFKCTLKPQGIDISDVAEDYLYLIYPSDRCYAHTSSKSRTSIQQLLIFLQN